VIAYFDTSALIPLVVEEPGSETAARLWDAADRVVTVRVAYVEGRAALAQARRLGRLSTRGLRTARAAFEDIWGQLDRVEVTDALTRRAGDVAEEFGLRGYDAIHLAASETAADPDLVLVAGDGPLCDGAVGLGLAVSRT
jgi:predicted nucleic acid-binding protein